MESKEEMYKLNVLELFADCISNYEDKTIKLQSLIGIQLLLEYGEEKKIKSLNENIIKKESEKISVKQKIEKLQKDKNIDIEIIAAGILDKFWSESI